MSGHAIEVRINAEDPAQRLHAVARHASTDLSVPGGPGVRFDTMLYRGLHGAAVLRLAARQADRLGRGSRAVRWRGCAGALGELEIEGVQDHQAAASGACRRRRRAGRRVPHAAGWRRWLDE